MGRMVVTSGKRAMLTEIRRVEERGTAQVWDITFRGQSMRYAPRRDKKIKARPLFGTEPCTSNSATVALHAHGGGCTCTGLP